MFNATPGADDGTAYTTTYRTPWAEIFGGYGGRLNRLQVEGAIDPTATSTTLTVNLYKDGDRSSV